MHWLWLYIIKEITDGGVVQLVDSWVVPPNSMEFDQASENPPPPIMEDISSLTMMSVPPDTGQKLHPNMEYDLDPFPTRVAPPLVPQDSLDYESSYQQVIL